MFKKTIGMMLASIFAVSAQASVTLNDVTGEELKKIKEDFVFSMTDGDPRRQVEILNVKRLSDSDNYYLKMAENGGSYTILYMKDINSILIQSSGEVYDLSNENFVSKEYEASFVKPLLAQIKSEDVVLFPSEVENAKEVFVFTDPTCGYCRKLHEEMADYNKEGITIKYLPYPRGGENNEVGFNSLANALCSENVHDAFDHIKSKNTPLERPENVTDEQYAQCQDKVRYYYNLGNKMGVSGTPAVFDKNGYQIGGYVPAQRMKYTISE